MRRGGDLLAAAARTPHEKRRHAQPDEGPGTSTHRSSAVKGERSDRSGWGSVPVVHDAGIGSIEACTPTATDMVAVVHLHAEWT